MGAVLVLSLCALPARGQESGPPPQVVHTLTAFDSIPTKQELTRLLGPTNELALLSSYALDPQLDFGVRLRAVRAMPSFCPEYPQQCHDAIWAVLQDIDATSDAPGRKILRQRAAIEALGLARRRDPNDLPLLLSFLGNASRDLRVAAARAMRDLCDPAALPALQLRLGVDESQQVKLAISQAVQALEQCGP
ncbi:MAG TPA: HEAT repeat domain-containing protein [Kofleriaceae bacterium]|nr:HEAT repeat domain-containing protein [Kofleriaceae bacterium]